MPPVVQRSQSVLDTKPSHVLNFPLTVKQQIWFNFLLPSLIISVFYIIDIATDIAVGCALINEDQLWAGILTLVFPYIAALIMYLASITNPPPENEFKVLAIWFLTETVAFVLFPLRPIQCFSERIFWAIEALRLEDPVREDALIAFEETKAFSIENYLFFQGIIHAGPQMLIQFILVALGTSQNPNTEVVQIICILSSLATLSMTTMSYHRYETQVNGSRLEIWSRSETDPLDGMPEILPLNQANGVEIPRRKRWIKSMKEDDPLGKTVLFVFWFLLIFGRCLCLTIAAMFFPWAVLGVCIAHFLFCLMYILPSSGFKSNIGIKILLSILYIFCLIEVRIQFRKSQIFLLLFIMFILVENLALTILWTVWANWDGWWYHYSLYLIGILHILSLGLLFIYVHFFQPQITRTQPNNSS